MFEIKQVSDKPLNSHHIYFGGEFISGSGYFEKVENLIVADEELEIESDKLCAMNAADLPDRFTFHIAVPRFFHKQFDYLFLLREGASYQVKVGHTINLEDSSSDWLIWNPVKYTAEFYEQALRAGADSARVCIPDGAYFDAEVSFSFRCDGMLGDRFKEISDKLNDISHQTHQALLKKAFE